MPIEAPGEVAFGPFRLDHRNRRLTKAGTAVPLGGRAIDVLSVLVAAAGDTVSKEVLLDRAWPGLTVDANNVEVQISALRKALGEDWIITVPKQGYRLAQRAVAAVHSPPPALPDKPSLVVLPFQNMSGDPEQDYFVDGLVEDITTSLCCIRSLFVIARNSAFSYKGQAVDVRQVGRELGVRYVMEGSVRRVGDRVRITGQLVEATTGIHVWGDRFDEALDGVFQLQDRVAERVAGAIEPTLQRVEIERARWKATAGSRCLRLLPARSCAPARGQRGSSPRCLFVVCQSDRTRSGVWRCLWSRRVQRRPDEIQRIAGCLGARDRRRRAARVVGHAIWPG